MGTYNLTLNWAKSIEIVFVDEKRNSQFVPQPPLPGIERVLSLKILGVTVTNGLSVSDHIRDVITNCAQTLYALRVLRAQGTRDLAL